MFNIGGTFPRRFLAAGKVIPRGCNASDSGSNRCQHGQASVDGMPNGRRANACTASAYDRQHRALFGHTSRECAGGYRCVHHRDGVRGGVTDALTHKRLALRGGHRPQLVDALRALAGEGRETSGETVNGITCGRIERWQHHHRAEALCSPDEAVNGVGESSSTGGGGRGAFRDFSHLSRARERGAAQSGSPGAAGRGPRATRRGERWCENGRCPGERT